MLTLAEILRQFHAGKQSSESTLRVNVISNGGDFNSLNSSPQNDRQSETALDENSLNSLNSSPRNDRQPETALDENSLNLSPRPIRVPALEVQIDEMFLDENGDWIHPDYLKLPEGFFEPEPRPPKPQG